MVSWGAVLARRLARHGLAEPLTGGPVDAVRAMCGAHAQVQAAAELSVALRVAGGSRAAVQAAVWTDRTLVRTFGPRGTVHLLPAADLPMWTGALSALPAPHPLTVLTPEQADEVVAAIATALSAAPPAPPAGPGAGGAASAGSGSAAGGSAAGGSAAGGSGAGGGLTVDELDAALGELLGPWAVERVMPAFQELWPRWRQATGIAAHRGVLCFGPARGRKVTYASPPPHAPAPAAGAALLRAYLHAYGPARPRDYAQWLAAPRGPVAELFAATDLDRVEVDGVEGWVVAGDTGWPDEPPRGLRLLPYFDAYAVGSHPRERVFPGAAAARALAGTQAGNFPVLLIDGEVAGVWHQRRAGRRLVLTVESLAPLSAAHRRELDHEAGRVAAILGGTPDLTVGPVSVGAHA